MLLAFCEMLVVSSYNRRRQESRAAWNYQARRRALTSPTARDRINIRRQSTEDRRRTYLVLSGWVSDLTVYVIGFPSCDSSTYWQGGVHGQLRWLKDLLADGCWLYGLHVLVCFVFIFLNPFRERKCSRSSRRNMGLARSKTWHTQVLRRK